MKIKFYQLKWLERVFCECWRHVGGLVSSACMGRMSVSQYWNSEMTAAVSSETQRKTTSVSAGNTKPKSLQHL